MKDRINRISLATSAAIVFFFFAGVATLNAGDNIMMKYDEKLPKLMQMLKDGDSLEKKSALRELWFLKYRGWRPFEEAQEKIAEVMVRDPDPSVRAAAVEAWEGYAMEAKERCDLPGIMPKLVSALKDPSAQVRAQTVRTLSFCRSKSTLVALVAMSGDPEVSVRLNYVDAAKRICEYSREYNARNLTVEENQMVANSLKSMIMAKEGPWPDKLAKNLAMEILSTNTFYTDFQDDAEFVKNVLKLGKDPFFKANAILTLSKIQHIQDLEIVNADVSLVEESLKDPDETIRAAAVGTYVNPRFAGHIYTLNYTYHTFPVKNKLKEPRKTYEEAMIEWFSKAVELYDDPSKKVRAEYMKVTIENYLHNIRNAPKPVISKYVSVLEKGLAENDYEIRKNAIFRIKEFAHPATLKSLIHAYVTGGNITGVYINEIIFEIAGKAPGAKIIQGDPGSRMIRGYSLIEYPEAVTLLINELSYAAKDSDKTALLYLLGHFSDSRIEAVLAPYMKNENANVRDAAVRSYNNAVVKDYKSQYLEKLKSSNKSEMRMALESLIYFKDPALEPIFEKYLTDNDENVANAAATAILYLYQGDRLIDKTEELFANPHSKVRCLAAINYNFKANIGNSRAMDLFRKALNNAQIMSEKCINHTIVRIYEMTGSKFGGEILLKHLSDPKTTTPSLCIAIVFTKHKPAGDFFAAVLEDKLPGLLEFSSYKNSDWESYRRCAVQGLAELEDPRLNKFVANILNAPATMENDALKYFVASYAVEHPEKMRSQEILSAFASALEKDNRGRSALSAYGEQLTKATAAIKGAQGNIGSAK